MKKKILFLSILPPPNYGSAMSSEMCLNILKDSKNIEVRNIKLNYSKSFEDMGKLNFNKVIGFFKTKKEIRNQIKNFKPDLIYFVPATTSSGFKRDYFFFKEIRKDYSKGIIYHLRGRVLKKDWENKRFRKKFSKMLEGQKAIVLGEELIKDLHGLISKENISILPNAIENEVSQIDLRKIITKRKNKKSFDLVFLSNMTFSKGWPKLLQACKILRDEKLDFKCHFVGPFPSKKEERMFKGFVIKNNLQKQIIYHGKKTGKEKNKILQNSDMLIFPTEYYLETFGRVILEAMMFSLPVIANPIATISSTIQNKKTGFTLEKNSPKEISDLIKKLHKNIKMRETLGKNGRKRFLEKYTLKTYKNKFLKILKNG